jgi:iron complex outermembrane receptor protein
VKESATLRVLKSADIVFPAGTTPQYVGNSEGFYRDGANATSSFLDLDGKYRVNSDLTVKTLFSITRGEGKTMLDQGLTFARYGTGISYGLNGINDAPDSHYVGAGTNTPGLNPDGSGYKLVGVTASGIKTVDSEHSLQFDTDYKLDKGLFQSIESGIRYSDHKRTSGRYGPAFHGAALATAPSSGVMPYPSDFGSGLGGGNWDNTGFTYSPEALKAYIAAATKTTTPEFERRVSSEIDMRERQSAAYVMANLEADKWSGNFGLRFVRTEVDAQISTPIPAGKCARTEPGKPAVPCAAYPTAITTAGDAVSYNDNVPFNPYSGIMYYKTPTKRSFTNLLPSLNLRYELDKDMIARFGASRTLGRQNYNVLGTGFGTPGCSASGCTVTGPNPNLTPLTSDNVDVSWAWYFKPRALVSVDLFHSKIDGYVKTGTASQTTVDLLDPRDQTVKSFFVNTSGQQGAKISGIEVSYEQPVWGGFGIQSNVSRAKTRVDDGRPMVGASEWAANLGGYFENDDLSARLVYNYRGKYVASSTAPSPTANSQGLSVINGVAMPTAPTIAAGVSTLAFSLNYNIGKNLVASFDATNLLNTARAQYRYSEEEPQKLDVSGRQFYLNLKYKF